MLGSIFEWHHFVDFQLLWHIVALIFAYLTLNFLYLRSTIVEIASNDNAKWQYQVWLCAYPALVSSEKDFSEKCDPYLRGGQM